MSDNKNMSNTMELDSILAEANARRAPRTVPPTPRTTAPASAAAQAPFARSAQDHRDPSRRTTVDDGFVAIGGQPGQPGSGQGGSGEKSKKPLIITLAVICVLIVAGIVALVVLRSSSSSSKDQGSVTEGISISGIDIAGMSYQDAKAALAPIEQQLASAIRIDVNVDGKTVTLTKDDFDLSFNTDEVIRKAQDGTGSAEDLEIRMTISDTSYATIADKVTASVDNPVRNARVTSFDSSKEEMFTFEEGKAGKKVKGDEFIKALKALIDSGRVTGTVNATCEEVQPAYNVDFLKKNIRKISSFTTYSTNSENGNENMRISLKACNNSIIEPGATWSFNECTGDSNLASNGYQPAGVIVQGRYETGIGGGICQSSTTIYNAAILSGMTVVERYCHAYPSSYVDYGRDATIDYGNLDLKVKNPYHYQLFLKCYMSGETLYAEIYGVQPEEFDEIRISTTDPVYGSSSYTVRASRTYYKDGKAVRTEELPSSTYSLSGSDDDTSQETVKPTTPASAAPSAAPDTPGGDPSAPDEPSADPGADPGENPGENPGDNPGGGSGEDPGDQPGGGSGEDPGDNPGENPEPGEPEGEPE